LFLPSCEVLALDALALFFSNGFCLAEAQPVKTAIRMRSNRYLIFLAEPYIDIQGFKVDIKVIIISSFKNMTVIARCITVKKDRL